jgi:hypothetical protein
MQKIYVCYINHGFIHHCLETSFIKKEDAQKWADTRNAQISQITGMRHAAESRYKNTDKEKYERVLAEASAFERKVNLHKDTWLADYEAVDLT